jgi:hypothetical protein
VGWVWVGCECVWRGGGKRGKHTEGRVPSSKSNPGSRAPTCSWSRRQRPRGSRSLGHTGPHTRLAPWCCQSCQVGSWCTTPRYHPPASTAPRDKGSLWGTLPRGCRRSPAPRHTAPSTQATPAPWHCQRSGQGTRCRRWRPRSWVRTAPWGRPSTRTGPRQGSTCRRDTGSRTQRSRWTRNVPRGRAPRPQSSCQCRSRSRGGTGTGPCRTRRHPQRTWMRKYQRGKGCTPATPRC